MIQLAVLLPALALSAANPQLQAAPAIVAAVAAADGAAVQNVPDGTGTAEEPGFVEKYFPLTFTPEEMREPETNENFVMLYLMGTGIFLANIWGPVVLIGNPDNYLMDSIISTVFHWIPMFIPVINFLYIPVNVFYLSPVATINIFDRNLKNAKRAGTWQGKAADANLVPKAAEVASLGSPVMAF
jgi:hypothetical protein